MDGQANTIEATVAAAKLIPWLPALAAILCGLCVMRRSLRRFAAPIAIAAIASAFAITLYLYSQLAPLWHKSIDASTHLKLFDWISVGRLSAPFTYRVDSLSVLMLLVVTGVGLMVTIYASGYMKGDRGYARFFAYVSLFIFAMTTLVLADNLVLLYLGWEGVGLCSYLLIGYYYDRPAAVAAAKKAFIVNRIGDLGFALGIFLIFWRYETLSMYEIVHEAFAGVRAGSERTAADVAIPFLLMLGAFGKSAQIPLYVWLPDAMEGPTPVSALIHAATMVTAGIYMIARLIGIFQLSPLALPTVALVGGLTAFFAATIALCQNDLKRVFAYSTVSQLGYMFLGVGVLSTVGGMFHLMTHAFFKALLFLTAGSVMHALAGQLDMRKISGLRKKMPVTCWLMFVGCLALAGLPPLSGYYSKDMILADALHRGLGPTGSWLFLMLALLGLLTAFITAFYTFRLWFRVFMGPEKYEMGDEHGHDEAAHDSATSGNQIKVEHHHEPHEMSWLMNGPLIVLAAGSIFVGMFAGAHPSTPHTPEEVAHAVTAGHAASMSWIELMVRGSTANPWYTAVGDPHILGMSVHGFISLASSIAAVLGIGLAFWFHWISRPSGQAIAERYAPLVRVLGNKYYVDELYDAVIVKPLRLAGEICFVIDRLIIDGLVMLVGRLPGFFGQAFRTPQQRGALQGYGLGMVLGAAAIAMIVLWHLTSPT